MKTYRVLRVPAVDLDFGQALPTSLTEGQLPLGQLSEFFSSFACQALMILPRVAGPVRQTADHRRQKSARSALRPAENPELLRRLRKTVATDIKFVHVVRNPYDNIATVYKRASERNRNPVLSRELFLHVREER